MPKQRIFTFENPNEITFDTFYTGSNDIVVPLLQTFANQSRFFCAYLWGKSGVGKTHLLQASTFNQNQKIKNSAIYLTLHHLNPLSFEKFLGYALVCIDDLQTICQNPDLEKTLFHFYNQLEAQKGHLILSSNKSFQTLPIQLPDLKSRIGASFILEIKSLSDQEKLDVLKEKAENRGFFLSEKVLRFLINHFPRDMQQLVKILDTLDTASLTEKHLITIPFIKNILKNNQ